MTAPVLSVSGLGHAHGALRVLEGLSFDVRPGEWVTLVGPSGCGKTTLLDILAGSGAPTEGEVVRRGRVVRIHQQDGLFPWLTVAENVEVGLRRRPVAERVAGRDALLALMRLEAFAGSHPHTLSGGMRQRVELARALAAEPDLLLMDEPFSALDHQSRLRLRHELSALLTGRGCTVVHVTHDLEEAAQLADRILVLTARPARIAAVVPVAGGRPRHVTAPVVTETIGRLVHVLGLDAPAVPDAP
jgi:NitT/TauT family transport system ATP-binding protein